VAANGSSDEKAKVRTAVHRKYPDMKISGKSSSKLYAQKKD
jgi:hypothetical protein